MVAGNPQDARTQFFTMGDAGYFLGAVALVNSLRLVGHDEPITFLDLGLLPRQRDLLATECTMVDVEPGVRRHPYAYQPYAHVVQPSGVCVIVDSDVIVLRRLTSLIDAARAGRIAAYPDRVERCFPEWREIFDLTCPLHPGSTYVNSGLVAFDAARHRAFLARWWSLCGQLEVEPRASPDRSTAFADQDALNALLMSEYAKDACVMPAAELSLGVQQLATTHVDNVAAMVCNRDGARVSALHTVSPPKPWTREARFMLRRGAYVTCLRRCLVGPDLAIEVDRAELPSWLRPGRLASTESFALQHLSELRLQLYDARVRMRRNSTNGSVAS